MQAGEGSIESAERRTPLQPTGAHRRTPGKRRREGEKDAIYLTKGRDEEGQARGTLANSDWTKEFRSVCSKIRSPSDTRIFLLARLLNTLIYISISSRLTHRRPGNNVS